METNPTTPLVTVLMPVYNCAPYLHEAIDSILGQTFTDFTLLIMDDGSTDDSGAIIANCRDPRIRTAPNTHNQGLIATLNRGLDLVETPYLARMDGDDLCPPDRLEKQVRYMEANPHIGASSGNVSFFGDADSAAATDYRTDPEEIAADMLFTPALGHGQCIIRMAAFKQHNIRYRPAYPHAEDWDLWRQAIRHMPLGNITDIIYHYRRHPGSVQERQSQAQKETLERIHRENLTDLGLAFTDGELARHIQVSAYRVPRTLEDYRAVEAWMRKLAACETPGLRKSLARRWRTLFHRQFIYLGLPAWRIYRRSPLRLPGTTPTGEELIAWLRCLRTSLGSFLRGLLG